MRKYARKKAPNAAPRPGYSRHEIVAVHAETGEVVWQSEPISTVAIRPLTITVSREVIVFDHVTQNLVKFTVRRDFFFFFFFFSFFLSFSLLPIS